MGLMDRDYMRDSERQKTFTKHRTSTSIEWLFKISAFVVILYVGFKFSHRLDIQRRPVDKPVPAVVIPATTQLAAPIAAPQPSPQAIIYSQPYIKPAHETVVIKCIVQGKVSYGDATCPLGAITRNIATNSNQNVMVAVKAPVAEEVTNAPQTFPLYAQNQPNAAYVAVKAECTALEERIKYLDSLARQPQSGQTQDWIRGERDKARSRQFSLKCA